MDNKAWYKRISTCFWFLLASMPFWLSILMVIGSYFVHTDGVTASINDFHSFIQNSYSRWWEFFSGLNDPYLIDLVPTFIRDMFDSLLSYLHVTEHECLAIALGWFTWVYFIELLVDFIVWLPRFFHGIMERGFKKL